MNVEQMFDRYANAFYRYFVVRVGRDQNDADDLMQQLWLQGRLKGGEVDPDHMEAWLWRVAQNLLRVRLRRLRHSSARFLQFDADLSRELATHFDTELMPPELLARREVQDHLLLAITSLPSEQQALLIGRYFEDQSLTDLAHQHALSVRAVEGRLYRARLALRDRLAQVNDDEDYHVCD